MAEQILKSASGNILCMAVVERRTIFVRMRVEGRGLYTGYFPTTKKQLVGPSTETYQLLTAKSQDPRNLGKPYILENQSGSAKKTKSSCPRDHAVEKEVLLVIIVTSHFSGVAIGCIVVERGRMGLQAQNYKSSLIRSGK
jgi:hypothetical protein